MTPRPTTARTVQALRIVRAVARRPVLWPTAAIQVYHFSRRAYRRHRLTVAYGAADYRELPTAKEFVGLMYWARSMHQHDARRRAETRLREPVERPRRDWRIRLAIAALGLAGIAGLATILAFVARQHELRVWAIWPWRADFWPAYGDWLIGDDENGGRGW